MTTIDDVIAKQQIARLTTQLAKSADRSNRLDSLARKLVRYLPAETGRLAQSRDGADIRELWSAYHDLCG